MLNDIVEVMSLSRVKHSHFFDKDAMRFFRSRVSNDVIPIKEYGALFITSEQFQFRERTDPRRYTIRFIREETGDISEIGGFQQYGNLASAKRDMAKFGAWLLSGV